MGQRLLALLIVIVSTSVSHISAQELVTEYNIFIPYENPVALQLVNVTQFTAHLKWNIPAETQSRLKAMRVNCTTLKSLIEPYYTSFPPIINLYNPSISGSQITLFDLHPATQYSCNLVGAISLDVGREKLAILSESVEFATLMEREDRDRRDLGPRKINTSAVVGGSVGGVLIVIIAIVLMIIGYRRYRKKKKAKKKSGGSGGGGSGGGGGGGGGRHYSSARSSSAKKSPRRKPTGMFVKKSRSREASRRGKASSSGRSGNKKRPSKKRHHKANPLYTYNELHTRSSEEEEIFGYRDTELKQELTADFGWDPMTYSQSNAAHNNMHLPEAQKSRHIALKNPSTPALRVDDDVEREPYTATPPTYTKGKHYQAHFAQPLY